MVMLSFLPIIIMCVAEPNALPSSSSSSSPSFSSPWTSESSSESPAVDCLGGALALLLLPVKVSSMSEPDRGDNEDKGEEKKLVLLS